MQILLHVRLAAPAGSPFASVVPIQAVSLFPRIAHAVLLGVHRRFGGAHWRVAARLLGLPVVVTVHLPAYEYVYGPGLRARSKRWLYRYIERILNHALTDHLIYVSSRIGREAVEGGLAPPHCTTVIENGIDLSPFTERERGRCIREELGASPQTTVLCCIGRLTEQKGVDILLEAFCLLEPLKRNVHLWLVGDGPQRDAGR